MKMYPSLKEFLSESEEPVALAVLGAPAGGKGFTMGKIKDVVDDSGVLKTLEKGKELSVDKLRDEFRSKDSKEQLKGFIRAFYLMKQKAKEDPEEFGKWFHDVKNLWDGKFKKLMPELEISVNDKDLKFGGKSAFKVIKLLDKVDTDKVIDSLDKYHDYKRVVRYFQDIKQSEAKHKRWGVSYDESGDEPKKIIKNFKYLHDDKYVTDAFLIHPQNVASNLIQNFFRVVTGRDGGRDSSESIIGSYKDIEENKDLYKGSSEESITVPSKELEKVKEPLRASTVEDDIERGNKPIDVFVEVQPMEPKEAYRTFINKLDKGQQQVFKALLKYSIYNLPEIPQDAKNSIKSLTRDMSAEKAIKVLQRAADEGNYDFEYGGVDQELAKKAARIIKD